MAHPRWTTSLHQRLSLTIAAILAIGLATFGTFAYLVTRQATLDAASARLSSAATQLAALRERGIKSRLAGLRAVAADSAVAAALRRPSSNVDLTKRLRSLVRDTTQILAIELRDSAGLPIAILGRGASGGIPQSPGGGMGPLVARKDSIFSEMTAPVIRGGRTLGYLAIVSLARTSDHPFRTFSSLMGDEGARVAIGNADGSVWTDTTGPVARTPASIGNRWIIGGREYFGALAPIAGTPLVVAIETPLENILAPVWTLMTRFAAIATFLILGGVLVAWQLGKAVSRPIADLTTATEAIAAGVPWEHALPIRGTDEIGRLARSFATMVSAVRRARETLEHQVAERTSELQTALRRLETTQEELLKKERLAILGQMSSGIGHELRNPLGVMTNAVYCLTATVQNPSPKVRECLELLDRQVRTSEKIVSDLLDFARVKPPQRGRVALPSFIEGELKRVSIPKTIQVIREETDGPPPYALADEIQLGQIMLNVLTNAVQAMEQDGGTLAIRVAQAGPMVRIEVQDSGPGIKPEHHEQIFEPLFTTKPRGIGLGLSVSRGLARANGGELSARSNDGRGATFVIEVPADHHVAHTSSGPGAATVATRG